MTSIEDIRFILGMALVGVASALLKMPLMVAVVACIICTLVLVPYFILNPAATFWQCLKPSAWVSIKSILTGYSNIGQAKAWCLVLALITAGCSYCLFGLILCESVAPIVSSFEPRDRNSINIIILAVGFFLCLNLIIWYARQIK